MSGLAHQLERVNREIEELLDQIKAPSREPLERLSARLHVRLLERRDLIAEVAELEDDHDNDYNDYEDLKDEHRMLKAELVHLKAELVALKNEPCSACGTTSREAARAKSRSPRKPKP
jgi:chromosome segregation ATPase